VAESDSEDTFQKRLRKFKDDLGFGGDWEKMAEELRSLTGVSTRANHISGWQKAGPPGPATLAALAMLHPADPRGCVKWLRKGGEMPRLHVDRNERGFGVGQPRPSHARDLEVIEAVNRCALLVAEILRRDEQKPSDGATGLGVGKEEGDAVEAASKTKEAAKRKRKGE